MKCPHCLENFHEEFQDSLLGKNDDFLLNITHTICPSCNKRTVFLESGKRSSHVPYGFYTTSKIMVFPQAVSRRPFSVNVSNKDYYSDYAEACVVLPISPKASAALSRRCLQSIIREEAGIEKKALADEIQALLDSKTLPPYLSASIDAVRNIGNFAAHPIKSKNSGEIVEVEPGEAEWNLDVIEGLFEFYIELPAEMKGKKDKLNAKLKDVDKPDMKS